MQSHLNTIRLPMACQFDLQIGLTVFRLRPEIVIRIRRLSFIIMHYEVPP